MSSLHFSCWGSLCSIAIMGINLLPGNYALAHINSDVSNINISHGEKTDNLKIIEDGAQVQNKLFSNSSQLYVPNNNNGRAGTLTIDTSRLVFTDNVRLSSEHRNVNTLGNGGTITLQVKDLLLLRREGNTNDVTPTRLGGGGNITINTSGIFGIPQSVPEPTLTFSTLMSFAFYGAWKLKRKQIS